MYFLVPWGVGGDTRGDWGSHLGFAARLLGMGWGGTVPVAGLAPSLYSKGGVAAGWGPPQ